ncbi:MAG TPA: hypothetical protein VGJ13_05225 [Pseudonocardiaceae bacterium]
MALPANVELLFGERPEAPKLPAAEVSARFDELTKAIDVAPQREVSREDVAGFAKGQRIEFGRAQAPTSAYDALSKSLTPDIRKGLSEDDLASVSAALEQLKAATPSLTKDINLTNPISTGLVAFDLEAPAKMLFPRPTPLRNRIPRTRGYGTSHKFKVISGITGSGTGGVGNLHPGIVDSTQTNFAVSGASNSLYYHRGPKISYAGYDVTVPYVQNGVSDEVTWSAQFAGQGYQDIRSLSRTSLLYSSMLMEERLLLMNRGTTSGFSGAMAAPTGVTLTDRAPAAGETALSGVTTNIYVKVTSDAGAFGESVATAAATVAVTSGHVVDLAFTDAAQALGYNYYVSTGASDPGDASRWFWQRVSGLPTGGKIVLQGALPTGGKTVPTSDTSAYPAAYDGILPIVMGANSGYNKKINAAFATGGSAGTELQSGFSSLYDSVKADPDRALFNGADRKQLSEALKTGNSTNYQLKITQDEISGVTLGDVAVAVLNEVTGKRVEFEVHPWLPQGVVPILSDTLPLPDSQVSNVWSVVNVQDYMGVDWPVLQFTYDTSSYWFGTFICYAPQWNGCLSGITKA